MSRQGRKPGSKDRKPRSRAGWTAERREAQARKTRRLNDDQENQMVLLITNPGGPGISELARQFGLSPQGAKQILNRRIGRDAAWAATHARLSEGMKGNRHGIGRRFPEVVKNRWRQERRGDSNPNWKGGGPLRHLTQYKEFVESILFRDAYQCQICKKQNQLVVHHIKSARDAPELLMDSENCLVLCRACHARHHATQK